MTARWASLGQASTITERSTERLNDGASTLNAPQLTEQPEEGRSHADQVDRQRWVDAGDDLHDQAGGVAAIVRWASAASGLPVVPLTPSWSRPVALIALSWCCGCGCLRLGGVGSATTCAAQGAGGAAAVVPCCGSRALRGGAAGAPWRARRGGVGR